MLPQMRHNLLMVLTVLIILHQAGFGSSFNAYDLKFAIDSHEAFCLMAPKCTLSTTSSSGLPVVDLTEPFTDRVPSITDPALRIPSPGRRTRAPPTLPPFTGSEPPSTNPDSETTDPVPPTTDPVPVTTDPVPPTTDSISSMSSSFSGSLVSIFLRSLVPPPFGNDGSCCSSCSCDLPSCIQYGTCCPDLLEYLPTVEESLSKIKITCDYASLKKDRVPFKTPKGSHVWMYRKCLDDINTEPYIKERCEEPDKFTDLNTKIPVSDKITALTYQNLFCALCNNILEENIFYWDASIECSSNTLIPTSVNTIVEEVNAIEDCTIVYKMPENGMQAPTCTAKIRQCNVTGLWEQYDPVIEAACHAYTAIYTSNYNNLFCHLCNEPERRMPSQCQSSSPGPVLVSFTTLLKFSPAHQLAESPAAEYDVNKCNLSQTFDPMKSLCRELSCLPPKTFQGGLCEDSVEYLTGVTYEAFIRLHSNKEVAANTLLEEVAPSVLNIYQEYLIELGVLNQVYHHKLYYRESTNNASFVNDFFLHFNVYFARKHKTSNNFVNGLLFLDKEPHLFITEDDSAPKTFKMMLDYHKNWEIETHSNADFNRLPDNSLSGPFNHIPIYFRPLTQRLPDFVSKSKPILITKLLGCPLIELNKDEFEYDSVAKELYMPKLEATVQPGSFLLSTNKNGRSVYMCAEDYLEIAIPLVSNRTIDTHLLLNTTNSFSITPQGILSLICTIFSLICLILTLITYVIFSELRTQPGINNIGLVISLILAQALFQFGINQVDTLSTWLCQMIGVMIHFFWLMVMFWSNVCTFHMFKVFAAITQFKDSSKSIKQTIMYTAYTIVSSSMIVLITIIVSIVHPDFEGIGYGGTYCYITVPRMVGYTLAIPIGIVIVINLTLFVLVIIKVARMPTVQSDIKYTRNWMIVYAKLSTITGATWIVGFLYYFKEFVVLEYVHILLNGSQGVFLFLSFICNRRVLFMYKNKLKAMKKIFSEASTSRQKTYSAGT